MSTVVAEFLEHFCHSGGRFRMGIPKETSYEEMVRRYEARDPEMLEVMKLVLPKGSTAEQQLKLWKGWAIAERARLRPFIHVRHAIEPAIGADIGGPEKMLLDDAPGLRRLYQGMESARLYVDTESPEEGLLFYRLSEMRTEREGVRQWLEDDQEGFEESEADGHLALLGMPPWFDSTIVFAGIGRAAERFLLACGGPYEGSVFMFEHDPLGMRRVAHTFEQFLQLLWKRPLDVAKWIEIHDAVEYEQTV